MHRVFEPTPTLIDGVAREDRRRSVHCNVKTK